MSTDMAKTGESGAGFEQVLCKQEHEAGVGMSTTEQGLVVRCSACDSTLVHKRQGAEIVAIHNCAAEYRRGWNAAFAEVAISIPCDAGSIYKSELWYEKHQQALAAARREAVASYIDDHAVTCDCCQHRMIDVTAAEDHTQRQHCMAGDPEGEGSACASGWQADADRREAAARREERERCRKAVEALMFASDYPYHWNTLSKAAGVIRDLEDDQ